jgi:hypothetical protein
MTSERVGNRVDGLSVWLIAYPTHEDNLLSTNKEWADGRCRRSFVKQTSTIVGPD